VRQHAGNGPGGARPGLRLALVALALALATAAPLVGAAEDPAVDTALVIAVDISGSVDDRRYRLQMEGIAEALEDPGVESALLNGPTGQVLISMVAWADRPVLAVPWTRLASREDARALAAKVRRLVRPEGDFTCMTRMLRFVIDKIVTQIPAKPSRVVVDVSGDGAENCNPEEKIDTVRDELVRYGATVNGLPIKEGNEAETIEIWYKTHVMGGPGSFVLPADGYRDFGRAIRQKFVVEISGLVPRDGLAAALPAER
jgi:Protein of unknown function (DUF1194)